MKSKVQLNTFKKQKIENTFVYFKRDFAPLYNGNYDAHIKNPLHF